MVDWAFSNFGVGFLRNSAFSEKCRSGEKSLRSLPCDFPCNPHFSSKILESLGLLLESRFNCACGVLRIGVLFLSLRASAVAIAW